MSRPPVTDCGRLIGHELRCSGDLEAPLFALAFVEAIQRPDLACGGDVIVVSLLHDRKRVGFRRASGDDCVAMAVELLALGEELLR